MIAFRLGLLNPNTSTDDTDAMVALVRAALPAGAEVLGLTARAGHAAIEGEAEHVTAATQVLALMREHDALDGYLIACFDDPGVHAARELTSAPVVGIGHAAYERAPLDPTRRARHARSDPAYSQRMRSAKRGSPSSGIGAQCAA